MKFLEIKNISKKYGNHDALNQVSISIPTKGIFGLLGPNGAGKTSLIRIITQILEPDSGEIIWEGKPLNRNLLHKIGYLPEERGLYKKMPVEEQLIYFGKLRNLTTQQAKVKIQHWLEKLELLQWKNKNLGELSKGMQQKVQFIASVLHDPEIIILDEPFSGFDPLNSEIITQEILGLKALGKTIVFSTHRMETVEALCDTIALLNLGKCILEGKLSEVKEKFKKNIFRIEGEGTLPQNSKFYKIISHTYNNNKLTADIQLSSDFNSNDLLQEILPHVKIGGFNELLPSMNEIFISQVEKSLQKNNE